jgi:hypothetical protein
VTSNRESKSPKVLLIGENPQGSVYLAKGLQGRGCECRFAASYEEACSLLGVQPFDVVLSPSRLSAGSTLSLVALLEGSTTTLFYFQPVESGCWWLPVLRNGRNCFGSPALLPSEFAPVLDEVIEQIRLCAEAEKESKQSAVSGLRGPVARLPSSGDSPSAEPKRARNLDTLKLKAAG